MVSDIRKIIVCPSIDNVTLTYKSSSLGINKKCNAKKYYANDRIHVCLLNDFCKIEYSIKVHDTPIESISMNCTFTLNEEFHDLDEAISWANIMVALTQNTDLKLYINEICLGSCVMIDNSNPIPFDDVLDYCENIKAIENNSEVIFSSYERYTPSRYFISRIIRSYITKTEFTDVPREELKRINSRSLKSAYAFEC